MSVPMKRFSLFAIAAWFAAWVVSCSAPEQVAPAEAPDVPEVPVAHVTVPDRSEEVTEAAVRSVAALFGADDATRAGEREIESVHTLRSQSGDALCYVVNYADDKGFIVVSATKDYMPVLAFGDEGRFDVESIDKTGVSVWLAEQQAVIEHAAELPDSVRLRCRAMWEAYNTTREPLWTDPVTRSDVDVVNLITRSIREWEAEGYTVYRYSDYLDSDEFYYLPDATQDEIRKSIIYANPYYGGREAVTFVLSKLIKDNGSVSPLLKTKWEQANGYNQYIPGYGDVGCAAVAIGQIMKYHRYPSSYNWDEMSDNNPTSTTAAFLYDVGKKIGIPYGTGPSGTYIENVEAALKAHFGYSDATVCSYDKNTIVSDLDRKRPVYIRGVDVSIPTAHAWVCDGYYHVKETLDLKVMALEDCPSSYEPDRFQNPCNFNILKYFDAFHYHMNWGWGGKNDGYFMLGTMKVEGYNYTMQKSLVNIYPTN